MVRLNFLWGFGLWLVIVGDSSVPAMSQFVWLNTARYDGPSDVCMIGLPFCSSDQAWNNDEWQDDSEFAYVYLGVGKSAGNCLERAAEWHSYCQNSPLEPVQAMFMPTGETSIYPNPDHFEGTKNAENEGLVPFHVQLKYCMHLHLFISP
jgi:hypothetical protein